jgi:hypothetical protein
VLITALLTDFGTAGFAGTDLTSAVFDGHKFLVVRRQDL